MDLEKANTPLGLNWVERSKAMTRLEKRAAIEYGVELLTREMADLLMAREPGLHTRQHAKSICRGLAREQVMVRTFTHHIHEVARAFHNMSKTMAPAIQKFARAVDRQT